MAKKGQIPKLPTPKNKHQENFINAIHAHPMVVVLGPAGTGKSFLSAVYAGKFLKERRVQKIIITRPTMPTGRSIGFFPGSLEEKMEPWTIPIMSTLEMYLGKGDVESQVKNGNIEIVPFETIRGRSFDNSFIILDEAQNCTRQEIKAFVTRAGEHSKVIINGDITQSDLDPNDRNCGLEAIVSMITRFPDLSKHVPIIEFDSDDIVRSGLCKMWVKAFEKEESEDVEGLYKVLG